MRIRTALIGAAAGALAVGATTSLAGSGVGSVFNLGLTNTVDAQTVLTGNPGGNPQLKLVNGGTAAAVRAESQNGIGVNGVSANGIGQQGQSQGGIGLLGIHSDAVGANAGVEGRTSSNYPTGAGVLGRNTGGGPGLRAVVNPGAPPLAVNSTVKVANLNADLLDGLDSTSFQARVTGTCGAGAAVKAVNSDGSVSCEPVVAAGAWKVTGNSGTSAGTDFVGTTDDQPLELKVNGQRALRLEPAPECDVFGRPAPSIIGGFGGNVVSSACQVGMTIAGGGGDELGRVNSVTASFGTVGGGVDNAAGEYGTVAGGLSNSAGQNTAYATVSGGTGNTAAGNGATVPGGRFNAATGELSLAAGYRAKANHQGSFVWGDSTVADFSSTADNQFLVRASGGAKFVRGTSSFLFTGAALQSEQATDSGEAAFLRLVGATNPWAVLKLVKHPSSPGNFLECYDNDGVNPQSPKCHINAAGTYVAGSDFAESLPARGGKSGYTPGDVLVMSRTHPGEVERSHLRFDRALIGVYSTRPGMLGADKSGITRVGKDDVPVAITGIVPVKVTAANRPIRVGDLLTSSTERGRAMNAGRNPALGTVLGKALTPLAHGRGTIRMLVLLH